MAKNKKKRSKVYSGSDAKSVRPTITRYTAPDRSNLGQWWFERKKFVKITLIIALVVLGFGYLLYEFFKLVF